MKISKYQKILDIKKEMADYIQYLRDTGDEGEDIESLMEFANSGGVFHRLYAMHILSCGKFTPQGFMMPSTESCCDAAISHTPKIIYDFEDGRYESGREIDSSKKIYHCSVTNSRARIVFSTIKEGDTFVLPNDYGTVEECLSQGY